MLRAYRRHSDDCKYKAKGRNYTRCNCPIWCDGTLDGRDFRRSVKTRDWNEAEHRIRAWETKGLDQTDDQPEVAVGDLADRHVADMEARKLSPATLKKYRMLFRQLEAFAEKEGKNRLCDWTYDTASAFRQGWKDQGIGAVKKLERLKTVFRFAVDAGWIEKNPAAKLKPPKVKENPTLPYSMPEMKAILDACDRYPGKARQLRALVLLMRYSGLRIGDAVTLALDKISGGMLFLYTQKTGTPVRCPLPPYVLDALSAFEPESSQYFFWSGTSEKGAFSRLWMKKLRRVFTKAGIKDGHSHRFRDTFAVEMLLAGTPIERVSVLLGHSSIKVTQKHYNPWVHARQAQLEQDVRRSWAADPLATGQGKKKVVPIAG
jgi:integrase